MSSRLWHGGAPGLRAGDPLLPPSETNAFSRLIMSNEEGMTGIAQRLDRVYATTDRRLARAWASLYTPDGTTFRGGALYVVDLEAAEPDADLLSSPGLSYEAPRGNIISVYDAHVPYNDRHLRYLRRLLSEHDLRRGVAEKYHAAVEEVNRSEGSSL